MLNQIDKRTRSLETIAGKVDRNACYKLLTQVFLAKDPTEALQNHFRAMEKGKRAVGLALFYKAFLRLSEAVYGEMQKYSGNGHLVKNRPFKDCVALVILSVCAGVEKDRLAPLILDSQARKGMEYLNNLWGNYDVILSYVDQVIQTDPGITFEKAARQVAA